MIRDYVEGLCWRVIVSGQWGICIFWMASKNLLDECLQINPGTIFFFFALRNETLIKLRKLRMQIIL